MHGDVSSAIIILRDAVCGERSAFGGSGIERIIKVLAGDKLSKGGFIFRRVGGSFRVDATAGVHQDDDPVVSANFAMCRVQSLPSF